MTKRMKRFMRLTRAAICLATAWILLLAGVSDLRANGERDAGRGAGVPIRTAPAKTGRQRLAEERAKLEAMAGKRDPFKVPPPPNVGADRNDVHGPLPPGVRGLVIGQLRLKGIVREDASNTMIAVVTNRTNLAYFLHVHEDLYNGVVSRITPNAIYFQQKGLNPYGRVDAREVVLKLGAEGQEAR